MSLKDSLESGLDFVEFLGDRISITSKKELRDIYNSEFKDREGIKDPSFSSVLCALLKCNKARVKQGAIYINVRPQLRVYCDQWRKPRGPQTPHSPDTGTQETDETPSPSPSPSSTPSTNMKSVPNPKKKMATEVIRTLKMKRKKLTADKWGIVITSDPPAREGKIHFAVDHLRKSFALPFHIFNKGTHCIQFSFYTALHRIRCFTLEDEKCVGRASPLFLRPGESYDVVVRVTLNHYGYFPTTIFFEFCPVLPKAIPFCITRELEVVARTPLALELGPVAPYRPFQVVTYKPVKSVIVEGTPPPGSGSGPLKQAVKLRKYMYPAYLKQLAKQRMEDSKFLSPAARQKLVSVKGLLSSSLEMNTYAQRLHLLLHLEEIQTEVDIRKYDLRDQVLTRDQCDNKLLTLRAPGVAENRPSVLRGDCLRLCNSADKGEPSTAYLGYVHRVELDSVTLGFSKRLLFSSDMKFDVEFTLNRYCLDLQHRAVDLAEKHKLGKVLMFNEQLENNPEQHAAVQRIVAGSSRPAPHLVFGPPGTGKTITLVEAMHQVSKADPSARILACAPSNSACDLLCERLMVHAEASRIYRVYASSRDPRSIPKNMLKYCNWNQAKGVFESPLRETLRKYLIVVTTLVTAGKLVTTGIPVGFFTHVFVDEGGHAVESECVIPIAGLLSAQNGQLVLAGDPKQLGPILRSPFSLQYGLGLSLLERLMTHNALYQKSTESGHFDTRFVTKLLRNYRSHPAILKIPNELFYENELQVFADPWERDTYCNWEHLPKKGFPLIFHGVMGKDEREANSPSFFNVSEIEVVVDYLTKLMDTQGKKGLPKLCPKDIGIISPYRKQVEKIQMALKSVKALKRWGDLKELKVGSVEEFQGQERKVIMLSTVRSSLNYIKMDKDFSIGFLSNEKRFNVALTRARSLLIVVGNPVILNKDPTWEKLIRYCVKEKGYTGFDFEDAEGEDDLVSRLATLNINVDADEPTEEGEQSALQQQPGSSEDMKIDI
ncbi:putative helicase mov-10-B.1 [Liparis tanakae]|uniref:RNA helicase n=1 Tax=Liparis tanakae TaxID=230148 RepID=A0A4Z2IH51_9TELE|nr:putative helicase mov-10-B.1 [Liparis tanakae]